jgi:hypothetical protein
LSRCRGRIGRYSCPGPVPKPRPVPKGRRPVVRVPEPTRRGAEREGVQAGGAISLRRPKGPRAKRCVQAFQPSPRSSPKRGFHCHDYLIGWMARNLDPCPPDFPPRAKDRSELRSDAQGGAFLENRRSPGNPSLTLGALIRAPTVREGFPERPRNFHHSL